MSCLNSRKEFTLLLILGLVVILNVSGALGQTCGDRICETPENVDNCYVDCYSYNFFVATNGDDSWPGTFDEPFATITRARDAIRDLKQQKSFDRPVNVYIRQGTYYLEDTLQLGYEDSGALNLPITYQAYPKELTVISGGKKITSQWNKYNSNIYVTNVGSMKFNSLFVNGRRAVRAREPDQGYYLIAGIDEDTNLIAFNFHDGDIDPNWKNLREVEVISYRRFLQSRIRIDRVEGNKVYFQGPLPEGEGYDWDYDKTTGRYYVENVFEGLDEPGEWYLDKTNGDLFYWPLPEEDIDNAEIIAPVINSLVAAKSLNGYVNISNPKNMGLGSKGTISIWAKSSRDFPSKTQDDETRILLSKSTSGQPEGISYFIAWQGSNSNRVLRARISDGTNLNGVNIPDFDFGNDWKHIVWTWDSEKHYLYVDGDLVIEQDQTTNPQMIDSNVDIGGGSGSNSNTWDGAIDEVRIWNRAFTENEVENLYNTNTYSEDNMVASYSFENDFEDDSVNGNDGEAYGLYSFVNGKYGMAVNLVSEKPISDISFRGIRFLHTDWEYPEASHTRLNLAPSQHHGAIDLYNTKRFRFENNVISHVGEHGIYTRDYLKNAVMSNNRLNDIGYDGIYIMGTIGKYDVYNNTMSNNEIYDVGVVFKRAKGINVMYSSNTTISHNMVFHVPSVGIDLTNRGKTDCGLKKGGYIVCGGNVIEKNLIYDFMRELNDGGGIHVSGKNPFGKINDNILNDALFTKMHLHHKWRIGIYLDETSEDFTISNNLVYRTTTSFNLHRSTNNIVENNIFVDGNETQVSFLGGKEDDELSKGAGNVFSKNIIYFSRNSIAKLILYYTPNIDIHSIEYSDYNLYYSPDYSTNPDWNLNEWQGLGFDGNSLVSDPLFVDYENDNFDLQADSPAFGLGFEQIDFSDVGAQQVDCFTQKDCSDDELCIQMECVDICNNNRVCDKGETHVNCPGDCMNIAKNPGFESGFADWVVSHGEGSGIETIETGSCFEGDKCLSMQYFGSSWQGARQTVGQLVPGKNYKFSAIFKTSEEHQGYINLFDYDWKDSGGTRIGKSFSARLYGNSNWQKIEKEVYILYYDDSGESTGNHEWRIYLYGHAPLGNSDSVTYDSVKLLATNLVKNPGFEDGFQDWSHSHTGGVGDGTEEIVSENCFEGGKCLELHSTGTTWQRTCQYFGNLVPGESYMFSAMFNTTPEHSGYISLVDRNWKDSSGNEVQKSYQTILSGNNDWMEISELVSVPLVDDFGESTANHEWRVCLHGHEPLDNHEPIYYDRLRLYLEVYCGNNICDSGETSDQCPEDCALCTDGTLLGACSGTKPLYCESGNLVNRCSVCGCPVGLQCQADESCTFSCPGCDITGDGNIDTLDLSEIGAHLGDTGPGIPADINEDDLVDIYDMVMVGRAISES